MAWTVKTAIFDIESPWGAERTGLRAIDFYLAGERIELTSGFTAYATSFAGGLTTPAMTFNTSLSKVGAAAGTGWVSATTAGQPQRILCLFTDPLTLDEVRVNNYHHNGGLTYRGAKNVKITLSGDSITSTAYGSPIANTLRVEEVELHQHVAENIEDEQTINLRLSIFPTLQKKSQSYAPFNPNYIIADRVFKGSSVKPLAPRLQLNKRPTVATVRTLSLGMMAPERHASTAVLYGPLNPYFITAGRVARTPIARVMTTSASLPKIDSAGVVRAPGATLRFPQSHTSIGRTEIARGSTSIAYGDPVGFSFLNNGQRLPATYAHFVEAATGVSSLEIRMPGTGNEPEPTGAVNVQSVAFSLTGEMKAADNIGTYNISEATFDAGQWKVFAYRTQVKRVPATVPINQVLTLSDDGSQRRIRVPLTWGIGLGDTLTLPDGPPLVVGRCATTVQQGYKVVDVSEVAP